MGWFKESKLYNLIFGKPKKQDDPMYEGTLNSYFQGLSGYSPIFTSTDERLYELGLCRAAIHRKATESAKATPVLTVGNSRLEFIVAKQPNPWMTASQFYYRLRTAYEIDNNAYIVPIEDDYGRLTGLYPVVAPHAEIKQKNGEVYLVYTFGDGSRKAIEYSRIGHLKRMQYKDDFFGTSNSAFKSTADLLKAQDENTRRAIKNGSQVRLGMKLNQQVVNEADMQRQQRFISDMNFRGNETGVFIYDSRFERLDRLDPKPVLLDAEQKKAIDNSVYTYWGVNEEILQNRYTEDTWNAFYESELEPFFIQLGEVLTRMLYTRAQRERGNEILLTADRLQYASNVTKVTVAKEFFDRGLITTNQALSIINMAPVPDGDKRFIRAEYVPMDGKGVKVDGSKNAGESGSPARDEEDRE